MEALNSAQQLLDSNPDLMKDDLVVLRYKIFQYKGDICASAGNYRESQ